MTVKERILRIRLSERIGRQPVFAKQIGLMVMNSKEKQFDQKLECEFSKINMKKIK